MNFGQAVKNCFSNYATFQGRAPRSEYWYWVLFTVIVAICAQVLDAAIFGSFDSGPLDLVANLALALPGIAVTARRLHDVNRSGWWQLIVLTVIGILVLLYWFVQPSDTGQNRFGESPLPPPVAG